MLQVVRDGCQDDLRHQQQPEHTVRPASLGQLNLHLKVPFKHLYI